MRDLVASGVYDVGLAADKVDLSGIQHQVFATPRAVLAMPAGHRLASRQGVSVCDLEGERFIALAPEDTLRRSIEQLLRRENVQVRIALETPSAITICAAAAQGVGIGLVNPYAAEMFLDQGLVLRPFLPSVHFRTLLLFPPQRQRSQAVELFLKCLFACRNASRSASS